VGVGAGLLERRSIKFSFDGESRTSKEDLELIVSGRVVFWAVRCGTSSSNGGSEEVEGCFVGMRVWCS
jgi:hypothetical protein